LGKAIPPPPLAASFASSADDDDAADDDWGEMVSSPTADAPGPSFHTAADPATPAQARPPGLDTILAALPSAAPPPTPPDAGIGSASPWASSPSPAPAPDEDAGSTRAAQSSSSSTPTPMAHPALVLPNPWVSCPGVLGHDDDDDDDDDDVDDDAPAVATAVSRPGDGYPTGGVRLGRPAGAIGTTARETETETEAAPAAATATKEQHRLVDEVTEHLLRALPDLSYMLR
ncbi:hypothetical protein E4U41_006930, partial [Claviceps citrina]